MVKENNNGYLIFLVDDDPDDLENLGDAIAAVGCAREVHTFSQPAHLLHRLSDPAADVPHLIVLDYQSPGVDNLETIETIRSNPRLAQTVLAVYSSHISASRQQELAAKGVDMSINKGISMREIEEHVTSFCEAVAARNDRPPAP